MYEGDSLGFIDYPNPMIAMVIEKQQTVSSPPFSA
jgi:hypothetical protein